MEEPEFDKRGRRIRGEGPEWDTRAPDDPKVRAEYGYHPTAQLILVVVVIAVLVLIVQAVS